MSKYSVVGLEDGSWLVQDENGKKHSRWKTHDQALVECNYKNDQPTVNHYNLSVSDAFTVDGQRFKVTKADSGRVIIQPMTPIQI